MLIIGLTGGICCGKTTISNIFSQLKVPIIDADEISRRLLAGNLLANPSPALLEISKLFGKNLFDDNGYLIRSKLKELIFSSANASKNKKALEDIMHPQVYQEINQSIQNYQKVSTQQKFIPYLIVSIPLLIETADLKLFDRILVIDIDNKTQIERCSIRDNISTKTIKQIVDAQIPRQQRLSYADDILDNSKPMSRIKSKINKLHNHYLQLSQQTA